MSKLYRIKKIFLGLIKGESVTGELSDNYGISLSIVFDKKVIAHLGVSSEDKKFYLKYTEDFKDSGLPPFHLPRENWDEFGRVNLDISKTIYSEHLWYPFAKRIPNPKRPDFESALEAAGLTGDENELEVIGKLSNTSISQPWKFELLDKKAA